MSSITEQIRKFFSSADSNSPAIAQNRAFSEEYFGHTITLVDKGEIRFGPSYFEMLIDNKMLPNKCFGMNIWMFDNLLFGAEEWLTTSEHNGPMTRLVLFDLRKMQYSPMKEIHGFPEIARMEESNLIYVRREKNWNTEVEIAIDKIESWSAIFGSNW